MAESESPERILCTAKCSAYKPDEQAVSAVKEGPCKLK